MLFKIVGVMAVLFVSYRLFYMLRFQRFLERNGLSYQWQERSHNEGGFRYAVCIHFAGLLMTLFVLYIWLRTGAGVTELR